MASVCSPCIRIDWRLAAFLRQLRSQLVLCGYSLASPYLAVLVGLPLPSSSSPSSLLLLSCFRLLHAERDPTVPQLFAASAAGVSASLHEALRKDLATIAFILPDGLQILGLLAFSPHTAASPSSSALSSLAEAVAGQLPAWAKGLARLSETTHASAGSVSASAHRESPSPPSPCLLFACSLSGDAEQATESSGPTHARGSVFPWNFMALPLHSSSSSSLEEAGAADRLSVSVEDARSVLKTEKFLYLRSRLAVSLPLDTPVRVDLARGLCGKIRETPEDGEVASQEAERDLAAGEDCEDFLPQLPSTASREILAALRQQEEALSASSLSLFFCMPNGVYVHPTDPGVSGEGETAAGIGKADARERKQGSKDAGRSGEADIWTAVASVASKAKHMVIRETQNVQGNDAHCEFSNRNVLDLPWLRSPPHVAQDARGLPLASLSVIPVPAFLSSLPGNAACDSDLSCTYTPARGASDPGLSARHAQIFLDTCILVHGTASLASCAHRFRLAFCRQLKCLALQLLQSSSLPSSAGESVALETSSLTASLVSGDPSSSFSAHSPSSPSLSALSPPIYPRLTSWARSSDDTRREENGKPHADGAVTLSFHLVKVPWFQHPLLSWNNEAQPHSSLVIGPKWLPQTRAVTCLVWGDFAYHHYCQDNERDEGWGCCYRSLQLVISWFQRQNFTNKPVPSISDIQRLLKKYDMAHENLEIGSKAWIGTVEGSYVLNWYLHVPSKMLHLSSASELPAHAETLREHFDAVGTPVMMGVGDYAYTLVGVSVDIQTGKVFFLGKKVSLSAFPSSLLRFFRVAREAAFLVVDPHYSGDDADIDKILDKGWVAWKKTSFFEKTAGAKFINLALPQTCTEGGALFI
uniref:Peptidase family c78 protein n=1 Tax=Neospora caninum (strain Liverpool) TaxID=572307 RepID=A0A0F7UJR3_NEOCL|nr:TPA: peptidase family c78 protein [Neospora caninum Liverpool]